MGPLVQIEIPVTDVERSLTFYENVFGWTEVPVEIHNYVILDTPVDWTFGIALRQVKSIDQPIKQTILYFEVDDPEDRAERAKQFGGKVLFGDYPLPSYGKVWQITDPDGQRWGLFKPA